MILKLSYAMILGTQTTVLFEYHFHDTQTQLCCDVVLKLGTQTTVLFEYHFHDTQTQLCCDTWYSNYSTI